MDLEIFPRITNDDDPCDFCGIVFNGVDSARRQSFGGHVAAFYTIWAHAWCPGKLPMPRKFWTGDDGKQIPIEDMTLGHLCNTIRYMGERLDEARSAGDEQQLARIESYLTDLQAEQERRLPEIEKAQRLFGVLLKSARK